MFKKYSFILFFLLFAFVFQSFAEGNNIVKRDNFTITMRDGIKLDCTAYYPDTILNDIRLPCVVYCHGFGKSKDDNLSSALNYAGLGYYTLTYSMRGQGKSEGYSNLISTTESKDLIEVVNYLKTLDLIDKDRIAIIGSSQGGLIPFMSATYGLSAKCLVTDLISTDFASDWIKNGCIKMSLLWSLSYDRSLIRYSQPIIKYREWILSSQVDKWDSLYYYLPLNRNFSSRVENNSISILISNAFQDKYFSSNGLIKSLHKFFWDYKIYIGAIKGHGSETFEEENIYHDNVITEWLGLYLNGIQPAENFKFTFTFSSSPVYNDLWTYYRFYSETNPFDSVTNLKFYFQKNKSINEAEDSGIKNEIIYNNELKDTNLTMQEAVNYEFTGDYFKSRFIQESITMDTPPLDWNYNALGIPTLHLVYLSDNKICQFNFQIWECFTDGSSKFVSSINYTDRKNKPGKVKIADIEGDALGHIFNKGNKIRIILTNLDTRVGDEFLRTNPFVLPVLNKSKNIIFTGGEDGSYFTLPLKE